MVDEAIRSVGRLEEGDYYTMIIPGIADGEYNGANVKIASLTEIIRCSGELAKQIKDLPDGAEFKIKTTE